MAENIPNSIHEVYQADEKTKQFTLLPSFEAFAKNKGFSEQSIKGAKLEINRRLSDFNKEGMDSKRFNAITKTIGDMVENELEKSKSDLAASAKEALKGTNYSTTNLQKEPSQAPTTNIKEARAATTKIEINSSVLRARQEALENAGK